MIVDGKQIALDLKKQIEQKTMEQNKKNVCFVIFGDNLGSQSYIKMKKRFAESLGIQPDVLEYPGNLTSDEVKKAVTEIVNKKYDGIVLQLPLPESVEPQEILDMIPSNMDMDVLSTEAKNLFKNNMLNKIPPVARAVSEILNFYNVDMANKNILVVGTGKLVGEPVSSMLTLRNLTYKTIDKNTDENSKEELLKNADIIISGAGSPHFIKKEMIKPGVVLIDAGTSEQSGKLVGDIDPGCAEVASLMTPVPNGVGPVTMACLFLNI